MGLEDGSVQPGTATSTSHPPASSSNHNAEQNSEAGPSRRRSSTTTSAHLRPASPATALHDAPRPSTPEFDLATYPTSDLLRLLASLLQKIASTNDQLRPELDDLEDQDDDPHSSRSNSRASSYHPQPSPTAALFDTPHAPLNDLPLFTASRSSLSHPSSLLSFHARHVPSISIEAYLLRILKYCPTTNEVFLGLLVYFDRMSKLGTPSGVGGESAGAKKGIGRGFAIDSYNIHRLVIAGVTVASKFFSDVFYTNSRYAKVGGLPAHELNQLELQFLLLNDFRLVIPPEEMQKYGNKLLSYSESKADEEVDEVEVEASKPKADGQQSTAQPAEQRNGGMDVDSPAPQPEAASAPRSPRGRERERPTQPTQPAVTFVDPHRGRIIRDWSQSGSMAEGARLASPMRD